MVRLSTGPLKRDEYAGWFGAPQKVGHDVALLVDVDCFTRSYKSGKFDLKKLVTLYYDKAVNQSESVLKVLLGEGRNGSV